VGLPSIVPARAAGAPASTAKTNVMVIMIDTLRADHTELGGYKRATTPTLVARAGARATYFDQAQAPAASTIPSVKAFLTGLSPSFFGFSNSGPPPGTWTMADAFRAAGYATGGFSANPLVGGEGVSRGFDEFWSAGGDDFVRYSFFLGSLLVPADQPAMVLRYADRLRLHKIDGDTIRRRARSWLERNGGAPFFAYLHLYEPHWPYYDSGYGFAAAAAAKTTQRYSYVDLMNRLPGDPANTALRGTAALEETIARYDEGVRAADDVVAAVLRDLEELGSLDSTLVMITADHGEEFFEHNGYGHGHDVFEEQIHVPMLVLWPAEARFAGTPKTVMEPVSLLDVLPTFARWFDLPQRGEAIHGRSLAGLIMGTSESHPLLSEVHLPTKLYTAYREGPLKARFRHDPTTGPDLEHVLVFDLTRDPGEQAPLPVRDAAVTAFLDRGRALARERWERGARVWQATPPTL
jgi:arylsulfatase A-like enzyme